VRTERRSRLRKLDVDDVAQLTLSVVGDADLDDIGIAGLPHPLVFFGEQQVVRDVGHARSGVR
jgi:hypothetical protein